jgi:hypothetical protein
VIVKILLFSPFANVWDHAFPEALIAEGLVKQGADVVTIRCGTLLNAHCISMSASGVGPHASTGAKAQVCRACMKRRDLLTEVMPFPTIIIDDFVEQADRDLAEALVSSATPENWTDIAVDGVPIGRYAAYEFLLNHKLVGTNIPQSLFGLYLDQLRNAIIVHAVSVRLIERERPTHVLVYNRLYAMNHAFCAAAEAEGIPTYTLQGGGHITRRAETMTMYRDSKSLADAFRSAAWKSYQASPIGPDEVALVGEHFSGLLEASSAFAYSSAFAASDPAVLRARFSLGTDRPVLLIPMSSEDEINAAMLADALPETNGQVTLFDGQFEWIHYLLDFAAERPDLQFLLRVHPRMFPNKRESVRSPVVDELMELLSGRPSNVSVNLPTDEISLYDIMQVVDVVLSYRSSVGAELAAFGIPVVVPSNADFFTYPEEINLVGSTRDEYAAKIAQALEAGWSLENSRRAFRWFAFLFTRIAVDLSDSVSSRPIAIRPKKPGLRLWLWRKAVYAVIQFGPLLRERLALRGRKFPVSRQELFTDVLEQHRDNLSESDRWRPVASTVRLESDLLSGYLNGLARTLWKDISDDKSLTGRIRSGLSD